MRVLQVTAELFPLLKTGGLADVAGALPSALAAEGCDVRPLLPGFPAVVAGFDVERVVATLPLPWGASVRVVSGVFPALSTGEAAVRGYVVEAPELYDRPGNPYHDAEHVPYADNPERFGALGYVAARVAHGLDATWRPDVVHGHDWHAGLAPAYLRLLEERGAAHVPSVFTVHNLAYQGVYPASRLPGLGLPWDYLRMFGLEFHGQLSFLKAGLYFADRLTTVSPTYAREIQHEAQGCGLHGLLADRAAVLHGILNGVDPEVWNPTTDPHLVERFGPRRMAGKAASKRALQEAAGLDVADDRPLFAMVSRLTEQKGVPLLLGALPELLAQRGQLFVLGTGDAGLEAALADAAAKHPGSVAVRLAYDEPFAHRVFGGSDVTLVPSRFEPCGLTQLYGLAYGSVPLVRRVGGLADTVVDTDLCTLDDRSATGIVFDGFDAGSLAYAVRRAAALYRRPADWKRVRRTGMEQRFDWATAARAYVAVYDLAAGRAG